MVDDSPREAADRKMVTQPSQSGNNQISVCCRGLWVKSEGGECWGGAFRATDTRPEENRKENADDHKRSVSLLDVVERRFSNENA